MAKVAVISLGLLVSVSSFGKDCGPIPPGATFGLNCEIVAVPPPTFKKGTPSSLLEISLQSGSEAEKKAKGLRQIKAIFLYLHFAGRPTMRPFSDLNPYVT